LKKLLNGVTWYDAAAYCNWLSDQEGILKDQWCYVPNKAGKYEEGMKMAADYLQRTGYRLPTEAEWEYACRADAETGYSFGELDDLVGKYAWYIGNAAGRSHPGGELRPNDLGLFDMHGNAWEWTQDAYKPFRKAKGRKAINDIEDIEDIINIDNTRKRVFRGGSFDYRGVKARSASRVSYAPDQRDDDVGFRPARTIP
jgi:formylglycine-generating enzyme required for sulfatase activity